MTYACGINQCFVSLYCFLVMIIIIYTVGGISRNDHTRSVFILQPGITIFLVVKLHISSHRYRHSQLNPHLKSNVPERNSSPSTRNSQQFNIQSVTEIGYPTLRRKFDFRYRSGKGTLGCSVAAADAVSIAARDFLLRLLQ